MFFSFFLVTSHKKDISLFWNDIHENNSFDRRINFFLDSWKAYFSSYYFIIVTEVSIFLLKCTSLLKCFWFISFRETPDSKLFYAQYEGRTKKNVINDMVRNEKSLLHKYNCENKCTLLITVCP